MRNSLRMLMLLTDGYGGAGGIAKFNRDFLRALDSCNIVERVHALPRLIADPIKSRAIPEAVVYDRKAARGKTAFTARVLVNLVGPSQLNLVICGHINLLPAAWLASWLRGARLVLIIHGIEAWEPPRKLLIRQLARTVNAVISVSRVSAKRFADWSNVPLERAFILPNCVDLEQFQPQQRDTALLKRYGLQSSRVILTVGRLESRERYKGFDEVINAMPLLVKRFPDLKYLIVGWGSDRARLEAKVADLGLAANVIFAGYIPESEKVAHYNLADVYVMPSIGEGFGIVLIEAAACGIPVVASQSDGSREALLDGQLGRLVDPKKPDELIQAVASFLERAPLRKRMDGVEFFNTQKFKTRVADWCHGQVGTMHRHSLG
jgi:glycosyltransferase involved in cell wall biosynthesis